MCVLQSLQISASSLSGFKKQPRSKPHKCDNKLIFFTQSTHTVLRLLPGCMCVSVGRRLSARATPLSVLRRVTSLSQRLLSPRRNIARWSVPSAKPAHAADKLFRYPLIERWNTQIDSAALGDLHADTHTHAAVQVLGVGNFLTCMYKKKRPA